MITERFTSLLQNGWNHAFARNASLQRSIEQATSTVCVFGNRMISRVSAAGLV